MIGKIAVLGAGTMGHGIAQLFACCGIEAALYDPHEESLEKARLKIGSRLSQMKWKDMEGRAGQTGRIDLAYTTDLAEALQEADLVIEAAPEKLELKRELYGRVGLLVKEEAIVASNTSTFSLAALSEGQLFADRMVIVHFFNPAPIVPLVEVVRSEMTRQSAVEEVAALLKRCGKVPVLLKKDIPGFIANRLQAAVMREACYLLQNGIADADQIDKAMTEGPGMRWAISGPFENADFGGLDVWEKVTEELFPVLDTGTTAPETIRDNVRRGRLGVKSGAGIYDYGDPEGLKLRAEARDRKLAELLRLKSRP